MAAAASLAAAGWVGLTAAPAAAAPFDPEVPSFWISQSPLEGNTTVYEGVQEDGQVLFEQVGDQAPAMKFNAMGFRSADGYLWALGGTQADGQVTGGAVVQIGDSGVENSYAIQLPDLATGGYNVGAFGQGALADRLLVTSSASMEAMYIIDVDTRGYTMQTLSHGDTVGELEPDASDWTAYAGYLWGGQQDGGHLVRVDPTTGIIDMFPVEGLSATGPFGGAWTYGNENLAFSSNVSGDITQIQVDDPAGATPDISVVSVVPGPASRGNDGANSPGSPTDLGVVKTAPASVGTGTSIEWNIEVTNHSITPSSGFTLTDAMPEGVTGIEAIGPNADLCAVTGLDVSCIGDPLVAGASVSYSFTGLAPDMAATLVNTANVNANEEDPNPINDSDSSTTIVVAPHLAVAKTSDAVGESLPGEVITFTVAVTNDGSADYTDTRPAELADDLSDVLDDATWNDTVSVTFSDGSSSEAPVLADDTLVWSGPLKVGETATISYGVTVTNAGNHTIINSACVPNKGEDPTCATTNTPLPALATSKTVDPASGTQVIGGQVLTYTLTYTNSGLAPAIVDDVDTLTGLLDDADITSAPVASDPSLAVSEITDSTFSVSGTIAAGATVTISYQATVKPDSTRTGDNSIVNWLLPADVVPPADCDSSECTINPVPGAPTGGNATPPDLANTGFGGAGLTAGTAAALLMTGLTLLIIRHRRRLTRG